MSNTPGMKRKCSKEESSSANRNLHFNQETTSTSASFSGWPLRPPKQNQNESKMYKGSSRMIIETNTMLFFKKEKRYIK